MRQLIRKRELKGSDWLNLKLDLFEPKETDEKGRQYESKCIYTIESKKIILCEKN